MGIGSSGPQGASPDDIKGWSSTQASLWSMPLGVPIALARAIHAVSQGLA